MKWTAALALVLLAPAPALADPAWPDLSANLPREGGGEHDAALVVGIETYDRLPRVPGAGRNAKDWYLYLTHARGVPTGNAKLVQDADATVEEIRAAADEAVGQVGEGGTFWFIFIGHGAPGAKSDDGLLVGADARQTANSLEARSLPQQALLQQIVRGKQARSVVVIDACFSGRTSTGAQLVEGLQPIRRVTLAAPARTLLFTAGKADQFAGPLPSADRPAFSYLVLGGLRGWADSDGDGTVTAREVESYTIDTLHTVLTDRAQTPQLYAEDRGAPLARGRDRGPDVLAMVTERERERESQDEQARRLAAEKKKEQDAIDAKNREEDARRAQQRTWEQQNQGLRFTAVGSDEYTVHIETGMGNYDCPASVTYLRPCRIFAPAAVARLHVRGSSTMDRDLTIPNGRSVVSVRHYASKLSGLFIFGIGSLAVGGTGFIAMGALAGAHQSTSGGPFLGTFAVGLLGALFGTVFAIIGSKTNVHAHDTFSIDPDTASAQGVLFRF